jgi:hypothetical protein
MKKLWFFVAFVLVFALFSDISFARRGGLSPTPKVFTEAVLKIQTHEAVLKIMP